MQTAEPPFPRLPLRVAGQQQQPQPETEAVAQAWTPSKLESELETVQIDELYQRLWAVAKKSGRHVDPLHVQIIKRRQILVSEAARLHLVWDPSRVYIKPIPPCLLDYEYWSNHLADRNDPIRKLALGFLRSYALLIQHNSDYQIAQASYLIPSDMEWDQLHQIFDAVRGMKDSEVQKRYHYGQMRMSRLDWATRLFRPKSRLSSWFYQPPFTSTGQYLAFISIPLLFVFATISLSLSAMQVMLAFPTSSVDFIDLSNLAAYAKSFWGFSIVVVILNAVSWFLIVVITVLVLAGQLLWGYRHSADREADDDGQGRP